MSLQLIESTSEDLCTPFVTEFVRSQLDACGSCLILVSRPAQAQRLSKALAACDGCSMGVHIETPLSWVRGLWELWGDGRRLVDAALRPPLMSRCIAASQAKGISIGSDTKTSQLLASIAQHNLPCVPLIRNEPNGSFSLDEDSLVRSAFTPAEIDAMRVLALYKTELCERRLIENAELLNSLAELLASGAPLPSQILALGFERLPWAQRALFEELSVVSKLLLVAYGQSNSNATSVQLELDALVEAVKNRCVGIEFTHDATDAQHPRDPELASVSKNIFQQLGACQSQGAVRLLLASGPLAEAELLSQYIDELKQEGFRDIVLASPDPARSWRDLAAKFCDTDVSLSAKLHRFFFDIDAGRALWEFFDTIAALALYDEGWPEPENSDIGPLVNLGPMDWWPPRALTDFLLSPLSGVSTSQAYALDREWRANRLLAPRTVLDTLLSPRHGSPALEQATRELLRARPASAALRLMRQFDERMCTRDYSPENLCDCGSAYTNSNYLGDLASAEVKAVLSAVMKAYGALKELECENQTSASKRTASAHQIKHTVDELRCTLELCHITLCPQIVSADEKLSLRILSYADAAELGSASIDCLILSGASSHESPIGIGDELKSSLLVRLGAEFESDRLSTARQEFRKLIALPRSRLVCERTLFTSDAKPAYPSVMLTELLACYGIDAQNPEEYGCLLAANLAEHSIVSLISPKRRAPREEGSEDLRADGGLTSDVRKLVLVPPEGISEFPDNKALLSASQIESYLECPCKWLSLRRLRLQDSDAGFSALEMGSFVHRVLELVHTRLYERALRDAGFSADEPPTDLSYALRGSALSALRADELKEAHAILDEVFSEHLRHQRVLTGKKPAYQALVAHSNYERLRTAGLHADLSGFLDFEAGLFHGFEPRFFEWSFGRSGQYVDYGSVYITGTVDRIDVDAEGNAIIIDYKHKSASGFFDEYAYRSKDELGAELIKLPRRVQSLIYAQIVRRAFPELRVVGALYLATKAPYEISGVIDKAVLSRVVPDMQDDSRIGRLCVQSHERFAQTEVCGMNVLLDYIESEIASKLADLKAGAVEAAPRDERACEFCPVLNCSERRLK